MSDILCIAGYTLRDQVRQRSFYILLAVCIFFVYSIRGCYGGSYTINGEELDSAALAATATQAAFHVIANASLLIAALLSMNVLSRDHSDGSAVLFLSRAVTRWSYVLGRVLGTWGVSFLFMFALHGSLFLLTLSQTGEATPGYLTASLLCSLNLLFIVLCVALLSLFLPDFLAALISLGIAGVSYVSDSVHAVMNSEMLQGNLPPELDQAPALWRVAWPKIMLLQQAASSFMGEVHFANMGPLHPAANLTLYVLLLGGLLIFAFSRREI